MKNLDEYRNQFPITQKYTFLNHAAVSPTPLKALQAVRCLMEEFSYSGISCYGEWMKSVEYTRSLMGQLINAQPAEIAFVSNTSDGLSAVANGINWNHGDVVLVPVPDFPSNIYPWMNLERYGVKVQFVQKNSGGRFGVEEVQKSLLPKTKLLSVSSVDFCSGFCADLEALGELCQKKGILFCVDAIQSLGVLPMDVRRFGIHFLATGAHKWLLGAMGAGVLYVSEDVRDKIHPSCVGWKSVTDEEDFFRIHFDLKPDALGFEPGTMNLLGIAALGAAIELIAEVGVERIKESVFTVNDHLFDGLCRRGLRVISPMENSERSGILSFIPDSDPGALFNCFLQKNVMVSLRGGKIRLSPHFYSNDEDVENFFRALDSFCP